MRILKITTVRSMVKLGTYVASFRREGELWEIRDRRTNDVVAHEPTKKDAIKVMDKLNG